MKLLTGAVVTILLLSGCADHKSATAYYKAANQPMTEIKLPAPGGGEYTIVTRRPNINQYEEPWVEGIKSVVSIASSPFALLFGAAEIVDRAGDKTSIDGSAIGNTDSHEVTEIIPMEEGGE